MHPKYIREKLLKQRQDIENAALAGDDAAAVVELDQSKVGRLSRMDAMQAQAMALASVQRREATLRRIDAALKRVDDGNYGLCLDCEESINPKRLAFDPAVALCIDCASKRETQ